MLHHPVKLFDEVGGPGNGCAVRLCCDERFTDPQPLDPKVCTSSNVWNRGCFRFLIISSWTPSETGQHGMGHLCVHAHSFLQELCPATLVLVG